MLKALVDGKEVTAAKGFRGICPICGKDLKPRCGEQRIDHWSHPPNRGCDDWMTGKETDWHREWKCRIGLEYAEVIIEKDGVVHRADICIPKTEDDFIIEFQNSPIRAADIRKREAFYGKGLIWVVNDKNIDKKVKVYRNIEDEHALWKYEPEFDHYYGLKWLNEAGNPYRIDIPKGEYNRDFESFILSEGFLLVSSRGTYHSYRKSNYESILLYRHMYVEAFNLRKEDCFHKLVDKRDVHKVTYTWKYARKAYNAAKRPVILDLNQDEMLILRNGSVEWSDRGSLIARKKFLDRIKEHIRISKQQGEHLLL